MIWVTSDTHFNHGFLVDLGVRPKNADAKMWKALRGIPSEDSLIHLGDVSFGDDDAVNRAIGDLPCRSKTLVRGNHDTRSDEWYLERGWSAVFHRVDIVKWGYYIVLTHEPCPEVVWTEREYLNIHGHLHLGIHRVFNESKYHLLISLEALGYQVWPLKTLTIKQRRFRNLLEEKLVRMGRSEKVGE